MSFNTAAFAAHEPTTSLKPLTIERRQLTDEDVHIKILFCGVCHSDLHQVKNEWPGCIFPMVPGHEMLGVVEAVGSKVTKFKKGDIGAVGCLADSCRSCVECDGAGEQFCKETVQTYNAKGRDGKLTYGGYSRDVVIAERFVCAIPAALQKNLAGAAPLLCAGVTTYTPMIRHGLNKKGMKIGVCGLGGLGHMAVKFGVAFGAEVTVISTSDRKKSDAIDKFGAKHFIVSKDEAQMKAAAKTLDCIIDTVGSAKDMTPLFSLLKTHGKIVTVGAPPADFSMSIPPFALIMGSVGIYGSAIGSMKETQEMLDFCGEHNIFSDVEVITTDKLENAYERMLKSDVRYRFVLDIVNSKF